MFHITVTNNDDGKVLLDKDVKAIVGGIAVDKNASAIGFTQANGIEMLSACLMAKNSIDRLVENGKKLKLAYKLTESSISLDELPNEFKDYENAVKKAHKNE